jgi:hypothetical protein
MRRLALGTAMGIAAAAMAAASPARAEPTAEARAAAQALFDQGKDLDKRGKYAEACPKFEESQRLDPRIATEFKLGDCFEHLGKTASAWASFVDVVSMTKAAGQSDREQVARDRVAALEKKLSKLVLLRTTSGKPPAGLRVLRDGTEVGSGQWGTPVPIDPGDHLIAVSATGKKAWQTTASVPATGATITINVPDLEDDPAALAAAAPPPVPFTAPPSFGAPPPPLDRVEEGGGQGQRIAGGVIGGLGVVGVVAGVFLGLEAKSQNAQAAPFCASKNLCTQSGVALTDQARSSATLATVGFLAGGAALGAGLVVFLTAPSSRTRPAPIARLVPIAGPGSAGGAVVGAW